MSDHARLLAWIEEMPRWPSLWLWPKRHHEWLIGQHLEALNEWAGREPKETK